MEALEMIDQREVARMLGVGWTTVRNWRHSGAGPLAIKLNRCVRYRRRDVEAWVSSKELSGPSPEAAQ